MFKIKSKLINEVSSLLLLICLLKLRNYENFTDGV